MFSRQLAPSSFSGPVPGETEFGGCEGLIYRGVVEYQSCALTNVGPLGHSCCVPSFVVRRHALFAPGMEPGPAPAS